MSPRTTSPDRGSAATGDDRCRSCGATSLMPVLDLGLQPLANHYPLRDETAAEEQWPLRAGACGRCGLVQLLGDVPDEPQVPGTSPSAHSTTMREHARRFVLEVVALAGPAGGPIVEVASHGGHLHGFLRERGLESLVVEGSPALADDLKRRGIAVVARTLGKGSSAEVRGDGRGASVVVDSYLLAHVRDPNDLVAGMVDVLRPGGRVVLELDHLLPIIVDGQFDAFRHGHLTYWSLHALNALLLRHGLAALSVTEQPVYGGALRVVAGAADSNAPGPTVRRVLEAEVQAGLDRPGTYSGFAERVARETDRLHGYLVAERAAGRLVAGYGAPTRGATLLNAARITPELLPFTVDRSPDKQGRLMPGSRIPIEPPSHLEEAAPDVVLILTWDIRDEVIAQQVALRDRGVRFVVPVPALEVVAG
jgi:SAM-dependent methyltransferase